MLISIRKWKFPTLPVNQCHSPAHPILEGMLRPSFVSPRRKEGPAMHFGYTWHIGKSFCKSACIFFSSLSSRIQSMGDNHWSNSFICLQRRKVKDQNKIKIWDASQDHQPKIQSSLVGGDSSKNSGARATTTADFGSSIRQIPTPATFACWKISFNSRPRYVFVHNFLRKRCNGSKKWSWLIQWMNWDLRHLFVVFQCRILKYLMRGLLQHWINHP